MKVITPRPDKYVSGEHHRLHDQLAAIATDVTNSGTTANRPTKGLYIGKFYFDTDLAAGAGKPIWFNGSVWVDATGTAV